MGNKLIHISFVNACAHNDLPTVKAQLEQGVDIHTGGDWPLKWAVENGHLDVVNLLREAAGARYKCHKCLIRSTCLELCYDFQAGEE